MDNESIFRWILLALLVLTAGTSAYHRAKARRTGEVIARRREG